MSLKILTTICMALASYSWARAQVATAPRITIAVGGAYEQSVFEYEAELAAYLAPDSSKCPCLPAADKPMTGYDLRASVAYNPRPSLAMGMRFELSHLRYEEVWDISGAAVLLEGQGISVDQAVLWREAFTMESYRLDLFARYALPLGGLTIEGGITTAYRRFVRIRLTQELIRPENARFKNPDNIPSENMGRTLILYDGTWPESNHFVPGALAGLSYSIPVIEGLAVVPETLLRMEFTPPRDNAPWPSYFLSGGVSVAYTF